MKSLLAIKLTPESQVLTEKGKKIKTGTVLAKKPAKVHKEKIPVGKILSINSKQITKYLKKKLGTPVSKGEVLAKRESIFKSIQILSPRNGFLDSVDLKDGTLLLVSETKEEQGLSSPVDGIIESISCEEIVISFEGKLITGEKGRGERVFGSVCVLAKAVDTLDFAYEVEEKIVIGKTFTEGARAKLNALGARGLISLEYYNDFPNLLTLSEKKLEDLMNKVPKKIILLGNLGQIIIPLEIS